MLSDLIGLLVNASERAASVFQKPKQRGFQKTSHSFQRDSQEAECLPFLEVCVLIHHNNFPPIVIVFNLNAFDNIVKFDRSHF